MTRFLTVRRAVVLLGVAVAIWAQQPLPPPAPPPGPRHRPPHPPPGPPLGPHPGERLPELRRHFKELRPVNEDAKDAIELARYFLQQAERAERENEPFQADRYAAAADAQMHIADHQVEIVRGQTERTPLPPPRNAVADHLEHAYFRLQQAAYFLSQSRDDHAKDLPKRGRHFYESAVQAFDKEDYFRADEYVMCVDDTVRTLEELAQAASPEPPPPPPPLPPGPPPRRR